MTEYVTRHHPLIGTLVEIRISGIGEADAARLDAAAVHEIERLERIFSAYNASSELSRWKRGELAGPSCSHEFRTVMQAARELQVESGGAFNPLAGAISAVWKRAEADGVVPDPGELTELAASIAEPRYAIDAAGSPRPTGDVSDLNLNAFAKGWIVDRALVNVMMSAPWASVVVNAGGDLAHAGSGSLRVGIENPLRPYDNEPSIATIELTNAGLATSGGARKGFRIGGRRYSHVIDPRTGQPVSSMASISVVADTAATADAFATVLGVEDPATAVVAADQRQLACLVVDPGGHTIASERWSSVAVDAIS